MKKTVKSIMIILLSFIIFLVVVVGGYVGYVSIQYYRIEDLKDLSSDIIENELPVALVNQEYTAVTYNIGFGAYDRDYSFFMDKGTMQDGTKTVGKYGKAVSKTSALTNTNGAVDLAAALEADIMLFQEVDIQSNRCFGINQYEKLQDRFDSYISTFGYNFHTAYLFYPFHDPHGTTKAGIATFSNLKIASSVRHKLPVDESFPNKFFDLDRCFVVNRIPTSNAKELVMINVHLSAYDEGGLIRAQQLEVLKTVLETEYALGNYVIAGGDFNHDIASTLNSFPTTQLLPEWIFVLEESQLPSGFRFASSDLAPTCRATDIPWEEGVNYTVTIDGFIVSDNVSTVLVENIVSLNSQDVNFMYSDHNPVKFIFSLID